MKMEMTNWNHPSSPASIAALTMPVSLYGIMVSAAITIARSVNGDEKDCEQ